jgi:amino acid adenylation domain-containing protein
MHKGWEQVVAAFGVMSAGSTYVPIDAKLPIERISLLVDQADVSMVVTQPWLVQELSCINDMATIVVSENLLSNIDDHQPMNLEVIASDPAYMIYTSGSTGTPKGVVIDHRGAVNTILDINDRFSVSESDTVLALSSLSFDLSVYDIFGLLAAGGTVFIPDADREKDPAHWVEILEGHKVTLWNSVPALAQLLIDQLDGKQGKVFEDVRLALLSGDWIPVALPQQLKKICPKVSVVSLGGATEASIWSIYYPITEGVEGLNSIPYGKPLNNQTFHVLDKMLEDRVQWVPGDLYIGGIGLAKEYFNSPEQNAKSFIVHPETKQRLYRTGDNGRYLPDGNIEFLGRDDNQVKIRGNRVELGEIEATINKHRFVQDSVVLALGDKHKKRLVSYLIPSIDSAEDESEESLDARSKLVFKLEQNGLRPFSDSHIRVELPCEEKSNGTIPKIHMSIKQLDQPHGEMSVDLEDLSRWLFCMSQYKSEDFVLPKRFYPSAGSLYPTQVYLVIKAGSVVGVNEGAYYYDPAEHQLILINSNIGSLNQNLPTGISAFLVSDIDAIKPIYSGVASKFCILETGHASQLLMTTAAAANLNIKIADIDLSMGLHSAFGLTDTHAVNVRFEVSSLSLEDPVNTVSLTALERQSFRRFTDEKLGVESLQSLLAPFSKACFSVFVYLKGSDTDEGRLLILRDNKLVECGVSEYEVKTFGFFSEATFSILLFSTKSTNSDLLAAGQAGQTLMNYAPKMDIGLCPVGMMDIQDLLRAYPELDGYYLLYALEGGHISKDQVQGWEQERYDTSYPLEELKQYLQKRLPTHMLPSAFMVMDSFPLTPNGKVDRKALPVMDSIDTAESMYVPPAGPVEKILCEIWQNVLDLKKIGVDDNFFEIGGDSLMVTRVITQIRNRFTDFEIEISIADFFERPTIRKLSQKLAIVEDIALLAKTKKQVFSSESVVEEGEI